MTEKQHTPKHHLKSNKTLPIIQIEQQNIHHQNMTEKQHTHDRKINKNIFNSNDNKCNGYNDCSCMKRIMAALSYYQQISSTQPQQFIDFCDTYYSKQYLQDYI
eukprot:395811_1